MIERSVYLAALDQKNGIFSVNAAKKNKHGAHLSKTIQGKRNTPRLVKALEKALGYSIDFLRQIYREDVQRAKAGKPVSALEANKWYRDLKGINLEEELAKIGIRATG